MREPTLYRKFADAVEVENPPEGAILCWVVPVEPDQDSAIIALRTLQRSVGVSMSYNQAKKIVRVVLVGAGIGGDDE